MFHIRNFTLVLGSAALLLLTACSAEQKQTEGDSASSPSAKLPVSCTDPTCLLPQFLACTPSELKMPFMGNSIYTITVVGLENDICHYKLSIMNPDGSAAPGSVSKNCAVPKEFITTDTFGHFFGQEKVPGKEKVKAEQDRIETTYCQ